MTKPYAVIFDVDGVLVDSYAPHFQSWRRLFGELDVDFTEDAFRRTFGRTNRDIFAELFPGAMTDARVRELGNLKELYYREIIRHEFAPLPGAVELVDDLHAAGFALAVGWSGPPENVALTLEQLGRANRFRAAVTGADVTRGKPDPQVFLLAAERLGVPPHRCAVIEDAAPGVEAANRAGMASIGMLGTTDAANLSHARLVVASHAELSPEKIRNLIEHR
jgi:beta-phosphoglucomutase